MTKNRTFTPTLAYGADDSVMSFKMLLLKEEIHQIMAL